MVKRKAEERRSSVRAKRVLSIQYRLVNTKRKGANLAWHLSATEDMSIGGLSFYTDCEYRIDDTLQILVVMSGVLDIFKGNAKVVRVEKKKTGAYYLVAVKFVDKNGRSRSAKRHVSTTTSTAKKAKPKRLASRV